MINAQVDASDLRRGKINRKLVKKFVSPQSETAKK